jgi:uncharacterized membrane protein
VWALTSWRVAWEILTAIGASFAGLGPGVIFGPAVLPGIHLGTWDLMWLMIYMGTLTAFLYAFNLDLLERIPRLGAFLHRARVGAVRTLRSHPWIRRLAVLGVALFVLMPLPGSGSLGGAMVARLIGLTRWVTFLVCAGAGALVSVVYAFSGDKLAQWLQARDVGVGPRLAGAAVFLLLVALLVRWVRRAARLGDEPPASDAGTTGG